MSTPAVVFSDVTKRFAGASHPAVCHLAFSVEPGEFVTVLGTSGCGKTTLLKLVNRLYEPDEGSVTVWGEHVAQSNPLMLRRHIGYVIQNTGLFPHLTIARNIATVPHLLGWDAARIEARVDELLALVGLDPGEYRMRYPVQLSGGQQQRVGIARALAAEPQLLLMDEPFGAVDALTRTTLREEIAALHRRLGTTILFVTHDINEAFLLGDRVLLMDAGRIAQFDTPERIVAQPADAYVTALLASAFKQEQAWEHLACARS